MSEYSALNLRGEIPDYPPEQKRLILKEGQVRLVEKQVKVGGICEPHSHISNGK
jgi:hypothetical protein